MPELPEVETTVQGIKPYIEKQTIAKIIVRHPTLRWPIPTNLQRLQNQKILAVKRRAKYILIEFKIGSLILHLGMSGRLRVLKENVAPQKHDHVDIYFTNHYYLRFTDPRRFGAILWVDGASEQHELLKHLGPEPLSADFNARYLFGKTQTRSQVIKNLIMNSRIVVGVGNIYAAESLFLAHIHPLTPAKKLTLKQCEQLVNAIKKVLQKAIKKGGTTLKDFLSPSGDTGYFNMELLVYGQGNKPCKKCGALLKSLRIGNRSTVYCEHCQIK